jgi:hypothetical protein
LRVNSVEKSSPDYAVGLETGNFVSEENLSDSLFEAVMVEVKGR